MSRLYYTTRFNYKNITFLFFFVTSLFALSAVFAEEIDLSSQTSSQIMPKVPTLQTINGEPARTTTDTSTKLLSDLLNSVTSSADANGNIKSTSLAQGLNTLVGQGIANNLSKTLNRYGKAQVDIFIGKGYGLGGRIDWLAPLYETRKNLLFTQIGVGRVQNSTLINFGLGHRHFQEQWMLGYYAFLDADITNSYLRTGLGAEGWSDYIKLGSNFYTPVSGWKRFEQTYWEVRPARGYDLNLIGYLPFYPALAARLKFERYFGSTVGIYSYPNFRSYPNITTIGLRYTPVPLVTFSVDRRSQNEMQAAIKFNFEFDKPWSKQVSWQPSSRALNDNRYDMVERSNLIVLEYKDPVFVDLPSSVSGESQASIPFTLTVTSKYPITNIVWSGSAAQACGLANGCVQASTNGQYILTLPTYQPGASNRYQLQAQVTNKIGDIGSSNVMLVTVHPTSNTAEPDQTTPLTVQPIANKTLTLNVASQAFMSVTVSGGTTPYRFFSINPALPAGLYLDPFSGMISGTPTALSPSTVYQITVTDSDGEAGQGNFTLAVVPAPLVASVRVSRAEFIFDPDNDYDQSAWPFSVSGGVAPYTFTSDPPLPDGLTFDSKGEISGGPRVGTETIVYRVTATDSLGSSVSKNFTLTVHE